MQGNTPRGQGGQRERPLQKSMFLQQHQPALIQSRPHPLQNLHYNPLKRSSMPVLQGLHQTNLSPSYHSPNISYNQNSYQTHSPIHQVPFNEVRVQSQHELLLPNNNINSIKSLNNIVRSDLSSEADSRGFNKFEKSFGFDGKINQNLSSSESHDMQQLVNNVIEQFKEKHMPNILKSLKKELLEDISHLRTEVLSLKNEFKSQTERQQIVSLELKSQGQALNQSLSSKGKKQQGDVKELQREFFLLERKYNQIEVKLSENLTNLYNQFQKINQKLEKQSKDKSFKISQVKSSLSPIMLEYKECFMVKKGQQLPRGSIQQQIIIGTCCYYIDRNGYLLDSQSKYLTDLRGHQIRLQQKHLRMLQQHKILYR